MGKQGAGRQAKPSKLKIALTILAAVVYVLCFGATALAGEKGSRLHRADGAIGPRELPAASLSPLRPEDRHGDYLNDVKDESADYLAVGYNQSIFDKTVADEMTSKFKSFNDEYEARLPYRLNGRDDDLRYAQANKELAEWSVRKLIQWHLDHTVKDNLEKQAKETAKRPTASGSARTAAQTVIALSGVAKTIRGTTMSFGDGVKAKFKYDLPSGLVLLALTNPVADATVDWHSRVGTRKLGDAANPAERMNVKLDRRFEELKVATSVQYGLLGRRLNYNLNKDLIGPLSAAVDQAQDFQDKSKSETIFRLSFGTRF